MSNAPTGSPTSLEKLTDTELIALLPATKADKYDDSYHKLSAQEKKQLKSKRESFIREEYRRALDTLWLRYVPNMRRALQGKVNRPGSKLCPEQQPSREDFLAASLLRAYQSFLAQTFRQEYENLPGYIWARVLRGAFDERKQLMGRFKDDAEESDDTEQKGSEPEDAGSSVAGDETRPQKPKPQKPILVSHPEGMPEPKGGEPNLISIGVRKVLDDYARDNPVSAMALRKKWIEEWTWQEVADELFPAEVDKRTLNKRMANARKFVYEDEDKVMPLLAPLVAPRKARGGTDAKGRTFDRDRDG